MSRKKTTKEFINELKCIYGDKYDYSKLEYKNNSTKVCITCLEHGEFWQRPNHLLNNHGCPVCGRLRMSENKRGKFSDFIQEAKKIHKEKYEYYENDYIDKTTKIRIKCKKCGKIFLQKPTYHLQGQGCPYCSHRSYPYTNDEIIKLIDEKFPDKYDFSKVNYKNNNTEIILICKKHNEEIKIKPTYVLRGVFGCKKCEKEKKRLINAMTINEFIKKARKIHGNKYDYSKVHYINNKTKVCITCPEHGEFWQTPFDHIYRKAGCKICKKSLLEHKFEEFLIKNKIKYVYQCDRNMFKWLEKQSLDFYLPDYNIAVECQGEQHYKPIEYFGGENGLKNRIELDTKKKNKCCENNIKLLYFYEDKKLNEENNKTINYILDYDKKNRNN